MIAERADSKATNDESEQTDKRWIRLYLQVFNYILPQFQEVLKTGQWEKSQHKYEITVSGLLIDHLNLSGVANLFAFHTFGF